MTACVKQLVEYGCIGPNKYIGYEDGEFVKYLDRMAILPNKYAKYLNKMAILSPRNTISIKYNCFKKYFQQIHRVF